MASYIQLFMFSLLFFISLSKAKSSSKPKAMFLPVSKEPSTLQYITHLGLGTPLVQKSFVVDLGGESLWMDCEIGYKTSTYQPGRCGSAPCSVADANDCFQCLSPPRPGCTNNTCSLAPENTVTKKVDFEELAMDVISLLSIDRFNAVSVAKIPNYIFACARTRLLDGLASGVKGMAGLGMTPIGLQSQFSSACGGSFPKKFAICLPSTPKSNGALFFGNAPYVFRPNLRHSKLIDITERFSYTRLYVNPMSTASAYIKGEPSTEYFVGVKSIMINRKPIAVNTTLLSINNKGYGGTKISTVEPYTVLESSIYKVLTKTFANELKAMNVNKVAPVAPFTECFSTEFLPFTQLGAGVPDISFVFENKDVYWEMNGANSMVEISDDVACLGFVDGGSKPRTSIVIGALQLEDNLLQFDLAASKLGFTSTLKWVDSECANFKF